MVCVRLLELFVLVKERCMMMLTMNSWLLMCLCLNILWKVLVCRFVSVMWLCMFMMWFWFVRGFIC